MQRARKRAKLMVEAKANPKESKVVIKEETNKKARIEALNFLVQWSDKDKEGTVWKFNKTRQVWLLKHMYMLERVPPKYFKVLLKYIATIQGDSNRQVSYFISHLADPRRSTIDD